MRTIKIVFFSVMGILILFWLIFNIYTEEFLKQRKKNEEKVIFSEEVEK